MSNSIRSSSQDFDDLRRDQSMSTNCDDDVDGDKYRQGHHDTRKKIKSSSCHFVLRGRLYDTVHVLLASYNLR